MRKHLYGPDQFYSTLYDQNTFYKAFLDDLRRCQHELVIESPFITNKRMEMLLPAFTRLRSRGVKIIINTRNPIDHGGDYYYQGLEAVVTLQELGVTVLYTVGHHRKLAIIDRRTIYEGSLNILSFNDTCEIMRKIVSDTIASELYRFIGISRYVRE